MAGPAVTVRAPAKVNLHLGVGARRPDGFHDLVTVYQAVSLYDEVTAVPAARLSVGVTGEGSGSLPRGASNLAARAARLLAGRFGLPSAVRLVLDKRIPVAAGLAGGSADAAGALLACAALWGLPVDPATLAELAGELGSDVPFALHGGTALGTGRGERLTPVLAAGEFHWVLGLADSQLATPAVYAELDRLRAAGAAPGPAQPAAAPEALLAALRAGDAHRLAAALGNDLQVAAVSLRPVLRRALQAGLEAGALAGLVSGSGPTCAFLTAGPAEAVRLASALAGAGVCRTVRTAVGPVPGARLVEDPAGMRP